MAKTSGLSAGLYLDGVDLSGDVGVVNQISGGPAVMEITGLDKTAIERLGLVRDGSIGFNAWFNPTLTSGAHPNLATLPRTDRLVMVPIPSLAIGDAVANCNAKQINYDSQRGADGALFFTVDLQANGFGVEWGQLLTAGKRSDGSATNPTSGLDDLVGTPTSTAFGATIYVQVFSFTGTSVTFTLRDAATEPTYANVTGGASAAISAIGASRWSTATGATIRRYLSIGTSGTFSQVTFAVAVVRHLAATI